VGTPFRVGFGFDIHRLIPGDFATIGGVQIPSALMAEGHSDADVLIHALCDALLGAVGLQDIGHHFPNTDESLKGIDSKILLVKVCLMVRELQYEIGNVDMTVISETPKINPYIAEMKTSLANTMGIETSQIGIKATTNEKLGAIGASEGIAAHAVALVYTVTG